MFFRLAEDEGRSGGEGGVAASTLLILSAKYFSAPRGDTSLPRQRRRQGNQGICSNGKGAKSYYSIWREQHVNRVWPAIIAIIENTCYSFVERLPSEKNEFLRENS